jgi:hypothetical protein
MKVGPSLAGGDIGPSQSQLVEETRHATVHGAQALATRLVGERASDVALARAGGAGDDHRLVLRDPAARRERAHEGLVEVAGAGAVDALHARIRDAQLGVAQVLDEAPVVAREHLGVDEQREALVERQRDRVG